MPIEVKRFAEEMESFWNKSKVTRQPQNPLCQNLGKVLCCRDNKIKLCKNAKKKWHMMLCWMMTKAYFLMMWNIYDKPFIPSPHPLLRSSLDMSPHSFFEPAGRILAIIKIMIIWLDYEFYSAHYLKR